MDDNATKLERHYKYTWLCSACGQRNSFEENVCYRCLDAALKEDEKKLKDLYEPS